MTELKLAGIQELSEMFDVTKATVYKYIRRSDFPEPLDRLASGPVWRLSDVEAWGREHLPLSPGRPPRERARRASIRTDKR